MIALVLWLAAQSYVDGWHHLPLEKVATTRWTHVCTVGPVVYRRKMKDGDWHITLDNGKAKLVLEIIPQLPLTPPRKGQVVQACGITRWDKGHGWAELHPVITIEVKQ